MGVIVSINTSIFEAHEQRIDVLRRDRSRSMRHGVFRHTMIFMANGEESSCVLLVVLSITLGTSSCVRHRL